MRISLSEFKLPGEPGVDGDVTYKGICYDVNSGQELDGFVTHAHFVCGYKTLEDGSRVGVLVHGTKPGTLSQRDWRMPRLLYAPSGDGITVTSTEFHFVESLPGAYVRLVGAVETEEKPGLLSGFLYEGWVDGEGDWYPISVPGSKETVVRGCGGHILACDALDGSDAIHAYCLESHTWSKIHTGLALEWSIEEIFQAGDGLHIIRGSHADGRGFNLSWKPR